MGKLKSGQDLLDLRDKLKKDLNPDIPIVVCCGGTACTALGCQKVVAALKQQLDNNKGKFELRITGCQGFCERGPIVLIFPQNIFYSHVKEENVPDIIEKTVFSGEILEDLLYSDSQGKKYNKMNDMPFYAKQKRLLLDQHILVDAYSIDDYIRSDGYQAFWKALSSMKPDEIIDEVQAANLRGRGGGGFPAAVKWRSCRKAYPEKKHYILCNGDEGDPGAYMDRSIMEGNPHTVIEGMLIGAYAIGSDEGYIYVRHEYPLAVERLTKAIEAAKEYGFLGKNILGTDFSFDLHISKGGGAFVCGESTALMASIEGLPGEPRAKHIHTAESGLYDMPSNLNNVETWANVPLIIKMGAQEYKKIGIPESPGTKVFSLTGKINNTGLAEVPMGITLREIIYDIGGNKGW